jgi:CspA family cold shock protein
MQNGSPDVAIGTVKWFNRDQGFWFHSAGHGDKEVFIHISAVEKAGFCGLAEGAKVSYEVVGKRGKESAETSGSVEIVDVHPSPPVSRRPGVIFILTKPA